MEGTWEFNHRVVVLLLQYPQESSLTDGFPLYRHVFQSHRILRFTWLLRISRIVYVRINITRKVNLCNFAGIDSMWCKGASRDYFFLLKETLLTLRLLFIFHTYYKRSLRFVGYIKLSHSSIIRSPERLWNRDVKVYRDNIAWIMDYRSASMNARALSISGKIVLQRYIKYLQTR